MKNRRGWIVFVLVIAVAAGAFLAYTGKYYHAEPTALAALESDENVRVETTDYGWYMDGPGEDAALIFYPGAKVEAAAYAPFLRLVAGEEMDVCLVEMPFRLAFFGAKKAASVMEEHDYAQWYIGGHSLGGAMAAVYAADNADQLEGLILCAAYPTKKLDESLTEISIYGSEDGVLNMEKVEAGRALAPASYWEFVIEGGNHAWFGNYGIQEGDGEASITKDEQQKQAVQFIKSHLRF